MTVELAVYGTRDATVAGAAIEVAGEVYAGEGTSKRDPKDTFDPEIADLLAIGRALEVISQKMLKRASGLIKHQDDMREYKRLQAKRKKPSAKKKRELEIKRVQGRKVVRETRCFS